MNSKTFKDVIKEVHENGICQQCGGCVSFCSSAEYNVIGFKQPNSPPEYINEENCLECGICYYLCPQTHILDNELNKTYKVSDFYSMPIGFIDDIYSCQANDIEFLKCGTDGGVVNSIINYLIEKKTINGAIVAKTKAPFARGSKFVDSKESLIKASGIKLDISPQLNEIQKFSTYTSTLPKLNHYKFKKLAIVGTPCQIYTIRCMQNLGVVPSQNVEICLGLFCYENFFFERTKIEKFEKEFNIQFKDIEKINIKQDLIFKLINEGAEQRTRHISFNRLNDYIRPACNACSDFTNIYADISFGGLASPDKFTTVITRTEKGKTIISKAIDEGIIKCLNLDTSRKNKMKELIIQFSQSKRKRQEDFMKNITILRKN
ncbi:MAG: Coenzyme F420 hydrogenase/dehydrogenase, beta subunit C-terminal domain [Promethearchaeota archaeon]